MFSHYCLLRFYKLNYIKSVSVMQLLHLPVMSLYIYCPVVCVFEDYQLVMKCIISPKQR
jgi:hypothetical protein